MELIQSKSILAKLLAQENLKVEQRPVQTASFDPSARVLTVPVFDNDISKDLLDLFIGHEVGHALFTPLSEMLDAAIVRKISKSILNVVEDIRIERKIKQKYPGLRKNFLIGYQELLNRNFFGINGKDLDQINFIDRLNLYAKCGVALGINFSDEEKVFINKAERCETYADVANVSEEIQAFMRMQMKENRKHYIKVPVDFDPEDLDVDESGPIDGPSENFDPDVEELNSDPEEPEVIQDTPIKSTENNPGDENNIPASEAPANDSMPEHPVNAPDEYPDEEIVSETDAAFKENEKTLVQSRTRDQFEYVDIPSIPPEAIIVDYKHIWKRVESERKQAFENSYGDGGKEFNLDLQQLLKDFSLFRTSTNRTVSYLAKEFERLKNADQLSRASTSKTGELNMNRLFAYTLTDDIFRRLTVVPGSKSHGLVMFIDWSGSMNRHMHSTIKQLLSLTMFCRKVGIPYEVYGFTSAYYDDGKTKTTKEYPQPKRNELVVHEFKLMNILSSRMAASENLRVSAYLYNFLAERKRDYYSRWKNIEGHSPWMCLSGTPLNQSIIGAMNLVPEFKKKYKLQVVNIVFLTDGASDAISQWATSDNTGRGVLHTSFYGKTPVICDPVTKNQIPLIEGYSARQATGHFIRLLKERTGSNVVGFYLLGTRTFKTEYRQISGVSYNNSQNYREYDDKIKKVHDEFNKFGAIKVTNAGYDEYYLLKSYEDEQDEEEQLDFGSADKASKMTVNTMAKKFIEFTGNQMAHKAVLSSFIKMIV